MNIIITMTPSYYSFILSLYDNTLTII